MIDIELFLVSLRNNKDADGRLNPIRLADTVAEEIKIVQKAINAARREWVGLTEEEIAECTAQTFHDVYRRIEAKLKEKNENAS